MYSLFNHLHHVLSHWSLLLFCFVYFIRHSFKFHYKLFFFTLSLNNKTHPCSLSIKKNNQRHSRSCLSKTHKPWMKHLPHEVTLETHFLVENMFRNYNMLEFICKYVFVFFCKDFFFILLYFLFVIWKMENEKIVQCSVLYYFRDFN